MLSATISDVRSTDTASTWSSPLRTLLQILLLLLLPSSSAPSNPAKRPRKNKSKPTASSNEVDPSRAFDQLTDRLSVWQALGTLGVDESSDTKERELVRAANLAKMRAAKGKGGGRDALEPQDERDWVVRFCEDVVLR